MAYQARDYIAAAVELIKKQEQFMPVAKWDYRQYSVGFGRKAAKGEQAKSRDEEAEIVYARVQDDFSMIMEATLSLGAGAAAAVPALASLAYNLSPTDFQRICERKTLDTFVAALLLYNKVRSSTKGHLIVSKGLTNRRALEARLIVWAIKEQPSPAQWLDEIKGL